jgi:hypothetical protein
MFERAYSANQVDVLPIEGFTVKIQEKRYQTWKSV